ncbi:hypothetical protein [Actinomadura litoris]|uniref:hypothetical protein n=1 Tax=Actinomadura litoris TaxID=2678616 RepID=UPI001FA71D30|nr:hypothetical protein [Actinomadura litoris]
MTTRRMFVMAGGALAPVLLLALLFDNQWVVDATRESDFDFQKGIGPLVSWSQYPQWRLTGGEQHFPAKFILALDFSLLVFLALLALFALAAVRTVDPRRGAFGVVIAGWWATVAAGGLSGFVAGPLLHWSLDLSGQSMSRALWSLVGDGASFGLMFGWLAGLGALAAFMVTRTPEERLARQMAHAAPHLGGPLPPAGALPPGGPIPQGGHMQPGAPMQPGQMYPGQMQQAPGQPGQMYPGHPGQMQQQPMVPPQAQGGQGLPPQHPAAVPYVPPGGAQQPQWGAAPVPPQGQQYPGAPVPQQPAPQQPAQPPVPAVPPPTPPADEAAAERSGDETVGDEEPEAAPPSEDAPPKGPAEETMLDGRPGDDTLPPPR